MPRKPGFRSPVTADERAALVRRSHAWAEAFFDRVERELSRFWSTSALSTVVRLANGALATSSIGGRLRQRAGRTFHHVIDPRTGTSFASDLHAVTVRAPSAVMADVAANVVLVLGSASGGTYLLKRGLSGLLICTSGRETVVGEFPRPELECHETFHRV